MGQKKSLQPSLYPQPWLITAKFSNIFLTHLSSSIFFPLNLLFPSYILISNRLTFLNSTYLNALMLESKMAHCCPSNQRQPLWIGTLSFNGFPIHQHLSSFPHLHIIPYISRCFPTSSPSYLFATWRASSSISLPSALFLNCVAFRDSDMPLIPLPH